ncbi:2-oxo acid dehydrogenase subunit E2 [Acetobacterium bakii]|uniref:2-oxo acid dehydrogenase subunit E2 n=1 Tax=Acetobacterium bakii TaxID=52689 RepID=UPI0006821469|nr:2-oxo acid dehydrogenase subunit E2 [Acetobacterium bakii]
MENEIIVPKLDMNLGTLEDLRREREIIEGLGKVRATPAARRLAKQHHIMLENILGTGPAGRVQVEDVESLLAQKQAQEQAQRREPEPVIIGTELDEISGNPENALVNRKPKGSLSQRVPALAKIKSMVDDMDLTPRLDTRGPDGRVVPGELGSIKRFQEKKDDFSSDYGEYVKVLPKRMEEIPEMPEVLEIPEVQEELPKIILNPELDFVPFVDECDEPTRAETKEEAKEETKEEAIEEAKEEITEDLKTRLTEKRKIISDRMVKSSVENVVITLTTEIDMTEIKELRKKITKKIEDQIQYRCTYTDFLLMAVSKALMKHPEINSSLIDNEIINHPYVHMGIAVAQEEGLIVPVIKNAHELSFVEMVKNRAETLRSVKNKFVVSQDLKDSTFTISNLGMYGILEFTAIINQPNSAILCIGEVVHRMRLHQGEAMMRSVMKISLNLDHRVADGLKGAKFLKDVKSDMENPSLLLF